MAENALERLPGLQEQGHQLSRALHEVVLKGGTPMRKLADLLHGTKLGHPLHPVLTDFTIGAWGLGALFDAIAVLSGDRYARRVGDTLAKAGTLAAVPTMLTGLADYSTVQKPAISAATLHALLNDINFGLYLLSLRDRRRGKYRRGVFFSMLAVALTFVSAWLGGHLVYGHKVGVDHSQAEGPQNWTHALESTALQEGKPKRVEVDGNPVLLYRCEGTLHAIGAVCSHAGGPLEEGSFRDCTVQCPWHDSVFDLQTGKVIHGPATHPQPQFEAREQQGQIDVRLVQA